nr:hyp [Cotesia vestalis bracovirus]
MVQEYLKRVFRISIIYLKLKLADHDDVYTVIIQGFGLLMLVTLNGICVTIPQYYWVKPISGKTKSCMKNYLDEITEILYNLSLISLKCLCIFEHHSTLRYRRKLRQHRHTESFYWKVSMKINFRSCLGSRNFISSLYLSTSSFLCIRPHHRNLDYLIKLREGYHHAETLDLLFMPFVAIADKLLLYVKRDASVQLSTRHSCPKEHRRRTSSGRGQLIPVDICDPISICTVGLSPLRQEISTSA